MLKIDFLKGGIFLVISYFYVDYLKLDERPVVTTENGKIRGIFKGGSDSSGAYKAFMGIPYAKPPMNELRFESPELPDNWTSIRDAGYYRAQCISLDISEDFFGFGFSEDCLFLNIYVPGITHAYALPVMVYFHSGYWHLGSSNDLGEKRLMGEDVILVTLNYRLGALGFLSTGDEVVPGNQGLKDQNMALKWIQRNIQMFGGDPDRVTIFGEYVGAASVHLHILSPAPRGLFERAISQSGTALDFVSSYGEAQSQATRFAKKFNCPTDDNMKMVQCLKRVDASTLVFAHEEAFDIFRHRKMLFGPTIERINDFRTFLSEDPAKILERGDFPTVPIIIGVNAQDGSILTSALFNNETKFQMVQDWENSFPKLLQYQKNYVISSKIHDFYFKNISSHSSREDYVNILTNLASDRLFFHTCSRSAKLYSNHTETYLYYFNHTPTVSLNFFSRDNERLFHTVYRLFETRIWRTIRTFVYRWALLSESETSSHGNTLSLLFTHPWKPTVFSSITERYQPMPRNMVHLYTSFAKSWHKLIIDKVTWEPVNPQNSTLRYLEVSKNPSMIDEPFLERMKFWDSIYKSIAEQ